MGQAKKTCITAGWGGAGALAAHESGLYYTGRDSESEIPHKSKVNESWETGRCRGVVRSASRDAQGPERPIQNM